MATQQVGETRYATEIKPVFRKHNKEPHAYCAYLYTVIRWEGAAQDRVERRLIWESGDQPKRNLALLLVQVQLATLRLADAMRARPPRIAPNPYAMNPNFTMKGRTHSPATRAKISEGARRSWARGDRPKPVWLHAHKVPLPPVELPDPPRRAGAKPTTERRAVIKRVK